MLPTHFSWTDETIKTTTAIKRDWWCTHQHCTVDWQHPISLLLPLHLSSSSSWQSATQCPVGSGIWWSNSSPLISSSESEKSAIQKILNSSSTLHCIHLEVSQLQGAAALRYCIWSLKYNVFKNIIAIYSRTNNVYFYLPQCPTRLLFSFCCYHLQKYKQLKQLHRCNDQHPHLCPRLPGRLRLGRHGALQLHR